ncbi:hypothetical protein BKA23_2160 [Rudaeicoccus suwonensis]|uniref:Uncharacterized protein n=2 Tax=Rudaeicoccus suwonensis TaxID=657409 RepID=A0A561ECJ0_9MICO|nr:hypothetical protein BKA23_2160 [Rudaeicoccus suwonensis]
MESITGLSFEMMRWPSGAMQPGTRVRVVQDRSWDGRWASEFDGTIDATIVPLLVRNPLAQPDEREYSVVFDTPQRDAGGHGPYRKAVIWERYLEEF